MLVKKCQVVAEIESSEGTAETLSAADGFLAFNPVFTPNIDMHPRSPAREHLSPYPGIPGSRSARMSFDVELVGTAAAGNAIHFSDVLQGCGVDETLVAVTSATYTPTSSAVPSITLALYMDGKIYKLWGARGTFSLKLEDGKPGIFSFDFTGADFSETDGALLSGITLNSIIPPIFVDASLTIDSYSAILSKVNIAGANNVVLRKDVNATSGHKSAIISAKKTTLSFDPENVLVATKDFLGDWRAGSCLAFSAAIGSSAGNTITVTAPKVQYETVKLAERDGQSTLDIQSLLTANTGNDEWQIQVT